MNADQFTWTARYIAAREDIGIILAVTGILLSFVGFWIALVQIRKTKSAAQAAKDSAEQARIYVRRRNILVDFSTVMTAMQEITQHQRAGQWEILPYRYSMIRDKLMAVKVGTSTLTDEQQTIIQAAIQQFSDLETEVDKYLEKKKEKPRFNRLNELVNSQRTALSGLFQELMQNTEGQENG